MKAIIKFLTWLAANTLLLYAFLVALLIHVTLIAAFGWIKMGGNRPRIVASFDAGVLPPPAVDKEAQVQNAAHDFDYNGPTFDAGGGTSGTGPGGIPTAGGGTPESYQAHLMTPSAQVGQESLADVIGVVSDDAMAIARPEGGPTGASLPVSGGLGDTTIGTAGIKGPGGAIFRARMGPQRANNLNQYNGGSETRPSNVALVFCIRDTNAAWNKP